MNRLVFITQLAILGAAGGNTPAPTSAGNTSVTPKMSSVTVQTPFTAKPAAEDRKLKCYSCPETRYNPEEKCYIGDEHKTIEECASSNNICAHATYWIMGEKYISQGCINIARCTGQEYCKMDQNKSQCDVACCGWDLCNGEVPTQCYTCSSANESCNTGALTCASGYDMCVKAKAKGVFFKSCINQAGCKALKENCIDIDDCAVQCCYGNLCNGGNPGDRNGNENGTLLVALSLFIFSTFTDP